MIGHRVNGCTIALAAPSTLADAWAILAIRNGRPDGPGDEYVVASVSVRDIPTPDHWSNGYYTSDMNEALDEFSRKTSGVPMRRALAQFMEADAERSKNSEVIRRAALAYLHGEDDRDLAELADALGVPHEDVEAL